MAPPSHLPAIVTLAPTRALCGMNDVIRGFGSAWGVLAGFIMKVAVDIDVPSGVLTLIWTGPVPTSGGTVATACVPVASTVTKVAVVPPNSTVAPWRFMPVIVTLVPTTPAFGAKLAIVGAASVRAAAEPA